MAAALMFWTIGSTIPQNMGDAWLLTHGLSGGVVGKYSFKECVARLLLTHGVSGGVVGK